MLLRHPEYQFGQSDAVKDVVSGAADGLTVSLYPCWYPAASRAS